MNVEPLVVASLLALSVPTLFAVGAVLIAAGVGAVARVATVVASVAAAAGLLCAVSCCVVSGIAFGVRVDVVTAVMLAVVTVVGLVVVRFSRTSLHADPGFRRYMAAMLLTLAAVCTIVVTNSLWVMAAAWTATSLTMHQLLMSYRHRPQAILVAHKKFLASRIADVCIWSAVAVVHTAVGSADLDVVTTWLQQHHALPLSLQVAAVLIVLAAALRSAQLPFHGWLMQVMEAPTPVSALLHAGVVNIGGFLMIRLAPLMANAPAAQLLLVVIGTTTTVVAVLVMTTRISVKVMLAWSTCAQMGFMLVECGLGLWHLALLHIAAHSFYKAHAFLNAGTTVARYQRRHLTMPTPAASSLRVAVAVVVVGAVAVCACVGREPTVQLLTLALLLALALVPLLSHVAADRFSVVLTVLQASALVALYVGGHALTAVLVPVQGAPVLLVNWLVFATGLVVIFAVQVLLLRRSHTDFARRIHRQLFAGLHLDERFTRFTFRVWPPRLAPPQPSIALTTAQGEA